MISPIESSEQLRIGTIDFISPDEIKVLLDIEAPNDVSLNSGTPRSFPRINGYVLTTCENGFLVGQINWITVERSQYPKRSGIQDFGIIDLPYPLRIISVNPLGMLHCLPQSKTGEVKYSFSRGIDMFPTVGDPVYLPTDKQLKSIVETGDNRFVKIGTSPLAGNADVCIDPDKLFGRHIAVLGNTGSGKSCSVAGLIRWSIEAVGEKSNSRFIILDPNGEYTAAFDGLTNVRKYAVEEDKANGVQQLKVPIWLWNSDEWVAFTQASGKAQRPTLIQSLRNVREGTLDSLTESQVLRHYLRTVTFMLKIEMNSENPYAGGGKTKGFKEKMLSWEKDIKSYCAISAEETNAITELTSKIDLFINTPSAGNEVWPVYSNSEVRKLYQTFLDTYHVFGGTDKDFLPVDENNPVPFTGEDFLKSIEANAELLNTSEYVETMIMRVKTLLSDKHLKNVICDNNDYSLQQWIEDYICPSGDDNAAITIIDLSLLPSELTHIVTSVIARITLETLQRFRKNNNGKTLPTTIVMEEAHTFIKKYNEDSENNGAVEICAKIFEKIAREGRKFGLGLVLSSQRPSELSPTVLSQCNTFLLHRISNDRDQELVSRLVPDNLRGLLRDLPSLPSQNAILLGWATELPVMVQMNYLDEKYRPQSNDPQYWKYWTEKSNEPIQWQVIADDWQDKVKTDATHEEPTQGAN